jgi:hypothetical protein
VDHRASQFTSTVNNMHDFVELGVC